MNLNILKIKNHPLSHPEDTKKKKIVKVQLIISSTAKLKNKKIFYQQVHVSIPIYNHIGLHK